jgi:hypothetical protein
MLERELLRDRSTPRDAQHVRLVEAKMIEQRGREARDARGPIGDGGVGDPPTPGTSNVTTVGSDSASMNGTANSMLAPRPLRNRSGGRVRSPSRTA